MSGCSRRSSRTSTPWRYWSKPGISAGNLETTLLWWQNQPAEYLRAKSKEENAAIHQEARAQASTIRALMQDRKELISKQIKDKLAEKQQKKEMKATKEVNTKIKTSREVSQYGGPWVTEAEVESFLQDMAPAVQRKALVAQLRFHRDVVQVRGSKVLFQESSQGEKFSPEQLKEHFIEVLSINVDASEDFPPQDLTYRQASDIHEATDVQKFDLTMKLQAARNSRLAKTHLPSFLQQPSSLIGKRFLHLCRNAPGERPEWFPGTVLEVAKVAMRCDLSNNMMIQIEREIPPKTAKK
ncbi:hypothetical protein CAPTEDRAFT_215981 [Capitella teleta]|uniref:Uncharacterized protein n=1 Tax=Capitella teleta TaxID=283909 RepID=R7V992_CAPTE|nr:hypothetical protein CAPTEDRAFT_215981 [Capitella teleta]|eukprot:ELU15134.1 hypothetical protein CAPTEDRAFT_215981 [Capitella teleta]